MNRFLALLFMCCLFNACDRTSSENARNERIKEIELEISSFEEQKLAFKQQIKSDRREEMKQELQNQPNIVTYEWREMAEGMQKAEDFEHKAQNEEAEIQVLDQKILKLQNEKNDLLKVKS
jgi:hypothetical protein